MRRFSLEEARAQIDFVRRQTAALQPVRARLARQMEQRSQGEGSLPELKGLEARMSELLDQIRGRGIQIKGYAPVLVDLVWEEDSSVLLCWLEGEDELAWWHDERHGFLGRRPLDELP